MKRYRLKKTIKKKVKEFTEYFIASIGVTVFVFTILSCMIYSAKEYDKKMIEQEIQKKTEMSVTQISQN